jgi:hypothetical protein
MSSLITQLKFYFAVRRVDMTSMHDSWDIRWQCHCSLDDEETWDNPRYEIGFQRRTGTHSPLVARYSLSSRWHIAQDLAFKELLKRAKAWEDKNQMTFRGSLHSECRGYSITC